MIPFGSFPVEDQVSNSIDVFQGTIKVNLERGLMVYAAIKTKYLAIYDLNSGSEMPVLVFEGHLDDPQYTVINGQLKWGQSQERGFSDVCLTKDYIVVSFREGLKNAGVGGRKESDIPKSVYLFSYQGELLQQVNSSIPILRLSDNLKSNEIFAIGVTPEYCLMKMDFDED